MTLLGVRAHGILEGPSPWHVRLHAEVEILLVSIPVTIDETFGSAPTGLPDVPDVVGELRRALELRSAWTLHYADDRDDGGVLLSKAAEADLAAGSVLHPAGSLVVRQRLLPLEVTIERLGGWAVPTQRWSVTEVDLGAGTPTIPAGPVTDAFPSGMFRTLTVDEQLATPAFDEQASGVRLSPEGLVGGDVRTTDLSWNPDRIVLGPRSGPGLPANVAVPAETITLDLDEWTVDRRSGAAPWPGPAPVRVSAGPAVAVVPVAPVVGPVVAHATAHPTLAAAREAVRYASGPARVVEHWELA